MPESPRARSAEEFGHGVGQVLNSPERRSAGRGFNREGRLAWRTRDAQVIDFDA